MFTGVRKGLQQLGVPSPHPPRVPKPRIVYLEMINILVAVKLFGVYWKSKRVKIFCDNMAVVCVLQSGRTKDAYMAACARNIWLWSTSYDINFQFVHIAGKTNVTADLLSRWTQCVDSDKKLHSLVPNA